MNDIYIFIINATLRMAPPLILAGLGALISFKVGMLNISMEGTMLVGSFFGVLISFYTGSAWLGVLGAAVLGGLMALVFAYFILRFNADNILTGVAVNILALGLTTYLLRTIFGVRGAFSSNKIVPLGDIHLPLIDKIPVIGDILNNHSPILYIAVLFVIVFHIIFYKTPLGIKMQAIGEHQEAAETLGVKVIRIKYFAFVISGVLAGLGGAHLSLNHLTMFTENMTNGRGFMALAASIFGQRRPVGTFIAALIFAFADSLAMVFQNNNTPPQFLQMIPYILTLVVLIILYYQKRIDKRRNN